MDAQASQFCQEVDGAARCVTDQQLRAHFDEFDRQNPHAPLSGDDFLAIARAARQQGGTGTLLVGADNRFRAAELGRPLGDGRFEVLKRSILLRPALPWLDLGMTRSGLTNGSIHEDGDNTDGQMLYGPPGSAATWGCTGYGSVDTCKACCMASRSLALAPVAAWAKWCHTTVGPNVWLQIACGVSDAIALGVVWYSADKCNDNCETQYHNDRSIDWHAIQHGSLQQRLASGEYDVCEGWVHHRKWGGRHWLVLSEDFREVDDTAACMIHVTGENNVSEQLYWGALSRRVKVVGAWGLDMRPVDYRIVDVHVDKPGRQVPYVGTTGIDDDGVYITLRRTGERLYLDHGTIFESLKVWVYGERTGNRLDVQSWNVLWWSLLEGAF